MSEQVLNRLTAKWRAGGDSNGVVALKALDYCQSNFQPAPEWVVDEIVDCWRYYESGTPVTGWESDITDGLLQGKVPLSLDDAFGLVKRGVPEAKTNARMHWYGPKLVEFYKTNSRSPKGFTAAAEKFGITPSNAKDWYDKYLKFLKSPPPAN